MTMNMGPRWLGADLTRDFFQLGADVVVGPGWLGAEVTRGRGGSKAEVSEFRFFELANQTQRYINFEYRKINNHCFSLKSLFYFFLHFETI